jgi:hypothetical protein
MFLIMVVVSSSSSFPSAFIRRRSTKMLNLCPSSVVSTWIIFQPETSKRLIDCFADTGRYDLKCISSTIFCIWSKVVHLIHLCRPFELFLKTHKLLLVVVLFILSVHVHTIVGYSIIRAQKIIVSYLAYRHSYTR